MLAYFCTPAEKTGESAVLHMLTRAFVAQQCDKYNAPNPHVLAQILVSYQRYYTHYLEFLSWARNYNASLELRKIYIKY